MSTRVQDMDITDVHIRTIDYKNLLRADRIIMLIVLALAVVGIFTLISADRTTAEVTPYWMKQIRNIMVGAVFAAAIVVCDYRFLVSAAPLFYTIVLGLLVYVEVRGYTAKNAQSWIDFGVMNLQPSELGKIALIYMMAWYLGAMKERIRKFQWFALAFLIPAVPGVLILKQPDLGTTLTFGPVVLAMLYMGGCRIRHLALVIAGGVLLVGLVILHANNVLNPPDSFPQLKDYQKKRIVAFLDPESNPRDEGWHQLQTKIAIGSGGMWGKGYMNGVQTHLSYVPESHTDSIFALYGEEQGFVGSLFLLGLYIALLLRGLALARHCPDLSGALLAVGSMTIIATHIFINIAIAVGLMPVTGLPLPFLSYGGSFYITVMMCIGIVLAVAIKKPKGLWTPLEPVIRGTSRP